MDSKQTLTPLEVRGNQGLRRPPPPALYRYQMLISRSVQLHSGSNPLCA